MDAIQKLEAPAKKLILTKLAAALQSLAASAAPQPIQRVAEPDPEEGRSIQRVNLSPTITKSTNPTAPRTLKAKPRSHLRKMRANTPKTVPPIVNPTPPPTGVRTKANVIEPIYTITFSPSSNRMPVCSPNMIFQEAVNFISEKVYNEDPNTWMPELFITSSPSVSPKNNYKVDIEHFCAPVTHPITGETITKYQKLIKDPHTKDI